MSERKTLKVQPDTKTRLSELKRDGETWDGVLQRAADALAADEDRDQYPGAPRCSDCGNIAHAWTIEGGELVCGLCAEGEIEA